VFAGGLAAALGSLAARRITPEAVLIFVIMWIPMAPAMVLTAALSSRKGGRASADLILMTSGDSTGLSMFLLIIWVFGWAIAVTALAMGQTLRYGSPAVALVVAAVFGLVILMLRAILLSTKPWSGGEGSAGPSSPMKDAMRQGP
jgi:hypothetical protein